MSSDKQIAANRRNAQKSTGPRSIEGKAAASRNALKTGIDAKALIIDDESPEELAALTAEYHDRFRPLTPEERHYVDVLVRDEWLLRRLATVDAQLWDYVMSESYPLNDANPLGQTWMKTDKFFARLQQRISATERSYKSALHELQALQAARTPAGPPEDPAQPIDSPATSPAIGFVPAIVPSDPPRGPRPAAREQRHAILIR